MYNSIAVPIKVKHLFTGCLKVCLFLPLKQPKINSPVILSTAAWLSTFRESSIASTLTVYNVLGDREFTEPITELGPNWAKAG